MPGIKIPARNMSFWVAVILTAAAGLSVFLALYQLYMPVRVLAPREDIRAGTVVGQNDIIQITVSRRDRHPLALSDPGLVIGKFAVEKLYASEPILAPRMSPDPKEVIGITGGLSPGQTYATFRYNEARWPNGLKAGDSVSVVGVIEGSAPQLIGERIRVLNLTGGRAPAAGQIEQLKNAITSVENSITLALEWPQVGSLFYGKSLSKEIWILPEHPAKESGGKIYELSDLERIRKEAFSRNGSGKADPKPQKLVPGS